MWLSGRLCRSQDDRRLPQEQGCHPPGVRALCRAVPRDGPADPASVAIDGSKFKAGERPRQELQRASCSGGWRRSRRAWRAICSSSTVPTGRSRPRRSRARRTAQREDREAKGDAAAPSSQGGDACDARSADLADGPDARSMATGGRGSGVVGYNVHLPSRAYILIVTHEVTNGVRPLPALPCCQGGEGDAGRGIFDAVATAASSTARRYWPARKLASRSRCPNR